MVAYLQKPEGSEAFHQIVDFLNNSHIKYALIENSKIYISLIQQFWGTATARTIDDGEVEITASIQLALIGYVSDSDRLTVQKGHFSPQWSNMKRASRGYSGVDFPLFPTMITTPESFPSRITSSPSLSPQTYQPPLRDITRQDAEIPQSQFPSQTQVADEAAFTSVDVDAGGAATTDIGLEAGQGCGTMHKTPTRPYDSPLPRVHTLGSDEGKNDLQQTKKVYSSALTKLIMRVKKLEHRVKTSGEKGKKEISTASATLEVSIAASNLVYIRRSVEKRKDKGKAIMKEDESVQKKEKKQLEQERLGQEEAIRLQEHINKEEKQRIARDAEIAKYDPIVLRYHALQNRSFFVAEVRKNMCMYLKNQGGYKQSHFNGMSYEDIRPIFERVWDQNNAFVPKDSEIEKEKLEDDDEKEELRDSMDVVLRVDRSSKNYKIFSEMLDDFDRQDVLDLHILVQERYDTTSPEGYDLLLWGDLKILFKPNEEDKIWKNQQDYNLISWRLFDSCGIHMLLMHTGIAIHMMIEKKYPLT
ncbi:hypothetical protein Tco_1275068 [Tanacetum coccineum]